MRTVLLAFALIILVGPASAQTQYRGYTTNNGTYVAPHYQTNPNSTVYDNYSTRGNTNPYTGKQGTVDPYSSSYTPNAYKPPSYKAPCYTARC